MKVSIAAWASACIASLAHAEGWIPHLTAEQWREDIHFLANELTRHHRNAYHRVTQTEFARSVESLLKDVPNLEDFEIVVRMQALAAAVGDGHTFLATTGIYSRLPIELFSFENDLRVVRAAERYRAVLGLKLAAVQADSPAARSRRLERRVSMCSVAAL